MPVINMQVHNENNGNVTRLNLPTANQAFTANQLLPNISQSQTTNNSFWLDKRVIIICGIAMFIIAVVAIQYLDIVRNSNIVRKMENITKKIETNSMKIVNKAIKKRKSNEVDYEKINKYDALINVEFPSGPESLNGSLAEFGLTKSLLYGPDNIIYDLDKNIALMRRGEITKEQHADFFNNEVHKKLVKISRTHHPDKYTDSEEKTNAEIKQTELNNLKDSMNAIHELCINDNAKVRKYSYYNYFLLSDLQVIKLKDTDLRFYKFIQKVSLHDRDNRMTHARNLYIGYITIVINQYKSYILDYKLIDKKKLEERLEWMVKAKQQYLKTCDEFSNNVRVSLNEIIRSKNAYQDIKMARSTFRIFEYDVRFLTKDVRALNDFYNAQERVVVNLGKEFEDNFKKHIPFYENLIFPYKDFYLNDELYEFAEERYARAFIEYYRIIYIYQNLYAFCRDGRFYSKDFFDLFHVEQPIDIFNIELENLNKKELWNLCIISMKLCSSFNDHWLLTPPIGKQFKDFKKDFIDLVKLKSQNPPSEETITKLFSKRVNLVGLFHNLIVTYEARIEKLFPEKILSPAEIRDEERKEFDREQERLQEYMRQLNKNIARSQQIIAQANKDTEAAEQKIDQALQAKISRIEKDIAKGKDKYTQDDLEEEVNNEPKLSDQEYERLSKLIFDRDNKPDVGAVTLPSTSATASNNSAGLPSNNLDNHNQQEAIPSVSATTNSVPTDLNISSQEEEVVTPKSAVQGRANAST